MSFGENLQFLRKMHRNMTQEELAEKMEVSRQTISKWELDAAFPEMVKAMELCNLFSCSMDELFRGEMNSCNEAYSDIRVEMVHPFRYVRYTVISEEPEDDALAHMKNWAETNHITEPQLIGWDFPNLSQEQINVYHMHGYTAACILPETLDKATEEKIQKSVLYQEAQKYAVITIKDPFEAPFVLIPNAYKTLMSYMKINGICHKEDEKVIACFEKSYEKDNHEYMDVYIAAV